MEPKQQPPYPVRMPPELRAELEKIAASNSRSLNAEVVSRLQSSVDGSAGLHLPPETLSRLKKAAKKAGRSLEAELWARMLTSLADLPPAEVRLREALEEARKENADLRAEVEAAFTDNRKRSTILYIILDTNGYPISWAEIHEYLRGINRAAGFDPKELQLNIITPDMESSSRRAQEAASIASEFRKAGKSLLVTFADDAGEAIESASPPAAAKSSNVSRQTLPDGRVVETRKRVRTEMPAPPRKPKS